MVKLSIVTINKDNAEGLEKTIKSIINQSYSDFEYIIIDGASKDSSVDVIKNHENKITYWISEPDNGIYNAMNKGIKVAQGEYVIFMNSGDIFIDNNVLSNVFFEERRADILAGYVVFNKKKKRQETLPDNITFFYFMKSMVWHQSTFTKRTLFEELGGYDEDLKISSDWKFALLAICLYNKSIEIIKHNIVLVDATGISCQDSSLPIMHQERHDTMKKYFPHFYDDYVELYRLKRYSIEYIKHHLKWRFRHFL